MSFNPTHKWNSLRCGSLLGGLGGLLSGLGGLGGLLCGLCRASRCRRSIDTTLARSKSNAVAIGIKDRNVVLQELLTKDVETASVLTSNVRQTLAGVG